jgi:Protein of unknown function (DUF 659)/Leucine Rich repeat
VLAPALAKLTALTELDLKSNSIGNEGAFALAPSLAKLTALQELHLNCNSIGDVGASALAPSLAKLSALNVLTEHDRVEESLKQQDENGWTLASDGWTDTAPRPLMNVIFVTPKGSYFMGVHAAGERTKDTDYIVDILMKPLEKYGEIIVCIVTDSAAVGKAAGAASLHLL